MQCFFYRTLECDQNAHKMSDDERPDIWQSRSVEDGA